MTLGPKAQLYVLVVSACGLAVLFDCIDSLVHHPIKEGWLTLAALTLFSGFFTIKVPKLPARLSVSDTFVFASVVLFGTCAGTLTVALDILVASLRFKHKPKEPIRVVFNVSAAAVSIWAAGHIFYALARVQPLSETVGSGTPVRLPDIFLPLVALATSYFLLNSAFVALALALEKTANAFVIWKNNFLWLSVNCFGGASVAALLVSYTQTVTVTVLGIIGPLLIITYLTFKTSFNRIDDATRHVAEVNKLYLSTIETLATAIDAKDQVTHGHIRRVQRQTLTLARELGLKDENQLKALEAAALLHDTGKLVVPEHILNKPGKLSAGEFDRMKMHAAAGADILSAISFPYPVVPIVRHHHENWDGSGYPDGLRGTDIPIGARILAVIDCFDALTSDRPYRRALLETEAMEILMQRRGTMYDPLVVDTFAAVKDRQPDTFAKTDFINETGRKRSVAQEATVHNPVNRLHDNSRRVIDDDFVRAGQTVLTSLQHATSATLAILYLRDYNSDEAFSAVMSPPLGSSLASNVMPLGSGVTGWVIANGRAMVNADATLDFSSAVSAPSLHRCTAVPLIVDGEAVGALACYMDNPRGFGDREVAVMEKIASTFSTNPLQELIKRVIAKVTRTSPARSIH
jgi:putative nucleotidyltransferase with HDIG domain